MACRVGIGERWLGYEGQSGKCRISVGERGWPEVPWMGFGWFESPTLKETPGGHCVEKLMWGRCSI